MKIQESCSKVKLKNGDIVVTPDSIFEYPFAASLLVSIIGSLVSLIFTILERMKRKKQEKLEEKKDVSTYINELNNKMGEVRTIQKIIDEKIAVQLGTAKELAQKNNDLKFEIDRLTELKKISEKQIEGLGIVFSGEMRKFEVRSRKENIMIASLFFFLGILVSLLLQLYFK